ncbi:MAG: ParB N-terminal domain-containing protein [Novosphingobium sp.]|nr:ParB N-terminal domain-containing protein [Novosphingobium sp.]
MILEFIQLDRLFVDRANMRHGRKAPDVSDLLPTVRARGVLQTLLVRRCEDGRFGIVAGARRYHAARIVAEERAAGGEADPQGAMLPCGILEQGDDAAAIEASIIENAKRLDPDEVSQWESFVRLVREGRGLAAISSTFGIPELAVKRILALGNLLPRIREAYRREEIDPATVRHLTLASKQQQRAWLALFDDPDAYCPKGQQLKAWLFGGQSIPVGHALFDPEASGLAVVADLFGEDRYFADADEFWTAQNAAVEARREALIEAGWSDVVIVPPNAYFHAWEYEKAAKRKGGRVYADVRANGEVTFHEGYVTRAEARRSERGDAAQAGEKPARPEIAGTLNAYVDLHRHAAVRGALCAHPGVALRLAVAHAIAGSPLWTVRPDPLSTRSDEVRASLGASLGESALGGYRRSALALLGVSPDEPLLSGGNGDDHGLCRLFRCLLDLPDAAVLDVMAVVMAETLSVGSAAVEAVGSHLGLDMADWWEADTSLFELVRDREVSLALLAEIAGETVARANAGEKAKTLKKIARDHLAGAEGRTRVARWVPRWMRFPPSAYTGRGGVASLAAAARARPDEPVEREEEPEQLAA